MICNEELALFDLNDTRTVAFLETLIHVSNIYGLFHKYVCLFICVFGSIANIIHIFVLTRPVMQKSAVNRLLSIIAVCDIFTMLSYLIFIIRFGFAVNLSSPPPGYALKWIAFLLTHVVGSIALHSITLYLSCATAYIRYKTLKKVGSKWNHENSAGPIFFVVASFILLLCIPTFLIHSVVKVVVPSAEDATVNETLYTVGLADFNTFSTCFVFKLNLWLTGIMFKVIPCILLMLFTVALLWELELNRRRRKLITSGTTAASRKNTAQSDRTTKVLIILLMIFLCTEFPQGILAILNGLFPNDVHQFVYLSLGELLDLLSLINCNTCFIVYPLISTQYRETLKGFVKQVRHKFYHGDIMRLWYKKIGGKRILTNSPSFCDLKGKCKECRRHRSRVDTSRMRLLSPNAFTTNPSNSIYNYNRNSASFYGGSTISIPATPTNCATPQPTPMPTPSPTGNCSTITPSITPVPTPSPTLTPSTTAAINSISENSDNDHDHSTVDMNGQFSYENHTYNFMTSTPKIPSKQQIQLLLLSKSVTSTGSIKFQDDVDVLL